MHRLHQNSGEMMDALCSHTRLTGRKITPAREKTAETKNQFLRLWLENKMIKKDNPSREGN
jgi:hypothetical protein